MPAKKPGPWLKYYWASKSLAAAYIFVAPVVALYQLGITLDPRSRSGADFMFADLFDRFGTFGILFLKLLLGGCFVFNIFSALTNWNNWIIN